MTAETAAVLPALMVVLAAALWAVTVVNIHLRCVDAARTGARAAARGEPLAQVRERIKAVAPRGAHVEIARGAEITRVDITTQARPPWASALPPVEVKASAVTATEPGAAQP
ncbi:TadE family type IV pilus minor pilin [Nonomuraea sp. NPDC049152]|uniref:TadE family type IV pilus minor pilin n=1 Tax=Nonomuraea sp. NPDC049152 TaxID=3154350 RepID=UPI0033D093B5